MTTIPTSTRPARLARRCVLAWTAVALLLLCANGTHAADFTYSWGHPHPQGNTVYAIAFADASHGWAVGGSGFVLRTDDGGVDWTVQHGPLEVAPDLYDLLVTPPGTLIVCGTGQGLYRSTDGGTTWSAPVHPPAAGLRDLAARTDGGISAAGEDGVILLSTDDGLSWTSIGPGAGTIRHHTWRTATEAYAVGQGVSHRTTNGGASWSPFIPEEFFGYNEVYFTDAQHGYVVEDFGTWTSTNGGVSWTEQFAPVPPMYRYRTLVLSPSHWLIVCHGEGGELWETTNAGGDWTNRMFTGGVGFPCLVQAPGGRVHFGSDLGDLYRTDDLGLTIQNATTNYGDNAQNALVLLLLTQPDGTLFAANQPTSGETSFWLRSDDAGHTWSPPASSPNLYWVIDGRFFDELRGVTGSYEQIRVTTDGGGSWQSAALPAGYRITRFALPAADRYFAGAYQSGGGGAVFRSTDSGLTWLPVGGGLPAGGVSFWDITFPTGSTGYACGGTAADQPRLYRTTNGGTNWTLVSTTGFTAPLRAMEWFDALRGVASQSNLDMRRTTDGGLTWTPVADFVPARFVKRSATECVALASYASGFLLTTDAGATWNEVQPPLSGPFPGTTDVCTAAAPVPGGWVLGGGRNRLIVAAAATPEAAPDSPPGGPLVAADPRRLALAIAPNPIRVGEDADTALRFRLPEAGLVRVEVYDPAGRLVRALNGGPRPAGEQTVRWDGRDFEGRAVSAGAYLVRLCGNGAIGSTRIICVR